MTNKQHRQGQRQRQRPTTKDVQKLWLIFRSNSLCSKLLDLKPIKKTFAITLPTAAMPLPSCYYISSGHKKKLGPIPPPAQMKLNETHCVSRESESERERNIQRKTVEWATKKTSRVLLPILIDVRPFRSTARPADP